MRAQNITRRAVLRTAALGSATLAATSLASPFVRGAYAAGTLRVGMWDHWVPGASEAIEKLSREWAEREKIDLRFDLITSNGDKLALTLAAEGMAKSGHDVMHFPSWYAAAHADNLVPVDDIVKENVAKYGDPAPGCEYLGKIEGHWAAVPTCYNSGALPPCGRIDLLKDYLGLDVTRMYPPPGQPRDQELIDKWTWDFFLQAAEKAQKGGHPFGLGMSTCTDAINANDAIFRSYGVRLVDEKGNITVKSDGTRQMLEWFKKLVKFMPESVFSWDNASNNKYLIAGQGSLILNPPSCWAVAVRDAPTVGEQLWTFSSPKGPKGRFDPGGYAHWGVWQFSKSQEAAKAWLRFMTSRENQEKLATAGRGFDIPPYRSMMDFKVWEQEGPPTGTNYNYPPRGDVQVNVAGYPAPVKIGTQMFAQGTLNKMIAAYTQQGRSIDDAMALAETEIEGFMRT